MVFDVVCYGSARCCAKCAECVNFAVANSTAVAVNAVTQQEVFYTTVTAKAVAVEAVAQHFWVDALFVGLNGFLLAMTIGVIVMVILDIHRDLQEEKRVVRSKPVKLD
jgi:hypothetical protein